jgi:hypothetical protein
MRSWKLAVVLAALSLLVAVALAAAQEPVRDFSQLDTRLKPGDTVWVTDAQGREVKGHILSLAPDQLTLEGGTKAFAAADVANIATRRHDSLGNGALIGLVVGAGTVAVACAASIESDEDAGWCALAALAYGGIGAGIGVGIDAMIPGKKQVVYRAAGPGGVSHARLSIAPVVTRRSKGLAVSFSF